ncbi:MAG: Hydroxyacylglutathione hydrolase [Pseudomonadota bacterium]
MPGKARSERPRQRLRLARSRRTPVAGGPPRRAKGNPWPAPAIGAQGSRAPCTGSWKTGHHRAVTPALAPTLSLGPVDVYVGAQGGKYPDGNQVIVRGRDARMAFDTPPISNHIGPALDTVDLVVLGHVHEDHMSGLHRLPHAPVHVHHADLAAAQSWAGLCRHYGYPAPVLEHQRAKLVERFHYQPRPDAVGYDDGAVWDLGGVRVRALHAPGHTSGHCVLRVEPMGIAFIGDIDLSGFGPYYGDATGSLAQFRRTLDDIQRMEATAWITSHHKGVITDRGTFIGLVQAYARRIDERQLRLLQMLSPGPRTLEDLVRQRLLYQPDQHDWWFDCAERHSIAQHLQQGLQDGTVRQLDDGRWAKV